MIYQRVGYPLAVRVGKETLLPELNSSAAGRRFVADAIRCGDVAAVRNRVAPLNGFPGGMLGRAKFFFLARMPPDRRRIKNNFRAAQRCQSCRLRIPLFPATAAPDLAGLCFP